MAATKKKPAASRVRQTVRVILVVTVLIVVAGLLFGGRRVYRKWRTERFITQAHGYLQKQDVRNAWLLAQRALETNPFNLDAVRLLADITAAAGSRQEITWRQRLALLQSDVPENSFAVVRAALRFGELDLARRTLLDLGPEARRQAAYFELVAAVAGASNDLPAAAESYRRAFALNPKNEAYELNLATLELFSLDPAVRARARGVVERGRSNPELRLPSLRTLVADALNHGTPEAGLALARELVATPGTNFGDQLLLLEALERQEPAAVPARLAELKQQAAATPYHVSQLLNWMNARGLAAEARAWAAQLPAAVTQVPVVVVRLAEANLRLGDWPGLEAVTRESTSWGELEIMRQAFHSRAFQEQGETERAEREWRAALAGARLNPSLLPQVADLLAAWGWKERWRDVLWAAAGFSNEIGWALRGLYSDYTAAGDTAKLLRVSTMMLERDPENLEIKNNVAALSLLLLDPKADVNFATDNALIAARELHEKAPADPRIASTYAFALHVRGRTAEGLKILRTLPPAELASPAVAAYYGVLLSAHGDQAEAARFLNLAEQAPLLPEERRLVAEARAAASRAR